MTTTEIATRTGDYYGDGETYLIWEITDENGVAAELYVAPTAIVVMNIWTREDRRGEGLARALWTSATTTHAVRHAPEWARTPEGDGFANAVGGDTIGDDEFEAATGITNYDAA